MLVFNKIRQRLLASMRAQSGISEILSFLPALALLNASSSTSSLPRSHLFSFFTFSNPVEL
jgi:hypothetical protein